MTYNLCYFLGNKAFVINFLLCVFAADRKGIVRTEFIFLTGIPTGLLSKFIWCVAVICQQLYFVHCKHQVVFCAMCITTPGNLLYLVYYKHQETYCTQYAVNTRKHTVLSIL